MVGEETEFHIPNILMSSTLPSMVNAKLSHQAINTMNGNSVQVTSNGTRLDFVIPTGLGSGVIKPKSAFISCAIGFNSSSAGLIYWTNPTAGTSSLINRIEIRAGGKVIDTMLDADKTANYLQTNFGNPQFNSTDQNTVFGGNCSECAPIMASSIAGQSMSSAFSSGLNSLNGIVKQTSPSFNVIVPLLSGLLNSQKAFPLYLLESALTVSIYLNDITTAFTQLATLDATNYTVTNATFNFSRVHIDDDIAQAVKASMREQKAIYNLDFIGYQNYRAAMAQGGGLTYVMTPHLKSLLGMVVLPFSTANEQSGLLYDMPMIPFNNASPQFNVQVFLDENRLVQYNVDSLEKVCLESRRLGKLAFNGNVVPSWLDASRALSGINGKIDSTLVNANSALSPSYVFGNFSFGFNSCMYFDADIGYSGRKTDIVRFQLDGSAYQAFTMYFILIHSACLSIDGYGNCTVD
jgi:hypothetical protein